MRTRTRVAAILLVLLCIGMLAAGAAAQRNRVRADISLSTPSTVGPNETVSLVVDAVASDTVTGNVTVFNETKTVQQFTYGPGLETETFTFSSGTLNGGTYNVSVTLVNASADISLTDSGSFVVSAAADVRPVELTAYDVTSCPLQASESAYGKCKQFAVNMTGTNTSAWNPLVALSESGTIYAGNITGSGNGIYHVRVVDPDTAGDYDTVFIDDDPVFQEEQETDRAEQSFLTRWDTAFTINTTGGAGQLQVFDIGTDHAYLMAPMLDSEYPIRTGSDLRFSVFATADEAPVPGYEIDAELTALDTGTVTDISPTPVDTNAVGLSNVSVIEDIGTGMYRLSINDEYSTVFEVKQFDISYTITAAATGAQKRTFKPGDRIEIEAYPTQSGERISADSTDISVILPGGRVMDVSQEPFTLPGNTSAGTATVQIDITVNGVTQSVSARIDIKRFKVLNVPLRDGDYGPQTTENFAPNATIYLFTSAVKLGTAGGIDDIMNAEFYALDDPDTGVDECRNSTTMLPGQIDDTTLTPTVVDAVSVRNSSLFADIQGEMHAGMLNQCVLELWAPARSGFFRGNIEVERLTANDTETGSFSVSTSRISVDGSPYSFSEGRWEWSFGPNETMAVRPRVTALRTHMSVPGGNITDGRVIELRGPGDSTPSNRSFLAASAGGPLVVFNAPETAGHYRAKFTVSANVTNNTGHLVEETAVGRAYFEVELFEVRATTDKYRYGPDKTVDIDATVTTPDGIAKQGATVKVASIRNGETETDYTNLTSYNKNLTNANGETQLHLTPDGSWAEGWYRVKLQVSDSNGKTDTAWTYFRVEQYDTSLRKKVNGQNCGWEWSGYYDSCSFVTGDNITFAPKVVEVETGSTTSFSVDADASTLIYRGGRRSRLQQEIPLDNLTVSNTSQAVTISTDTLSTGYYSLNLHLDVDGNTEIADDYFRIGAFSMTVDRTGNRWDYGPGQNVTYNISFATARDATVALDELYTYDDGTRNTYNVTATQPLDGRQLYNGTKHALFNVTVPNNANEDYHSGRIAVTVDGNTQDDYISFDVRTLFAGAPTSFDETFGGSFSRTTAIGSDNEYFDPGQNIHPQEYRSCPSYFNTTNYSFSGTAPSGSCGADDFNTAFDGRLNGLVVNNQTVYVSNDTTFNEAGDKANNLSRYEHYVDRHDVGWNLTDVDGTPELTEMNYTRHGSCNMIASLYGLTVTHDLSGYHCWATTDEALVTSSTFRETTYNLLVNRNLSRVYVSNDTVIGEAGDLANASAVNTTFTDETGITWNITAVNDTTDYWDREVVLNATNGYANGVLVAPSAADQFVGEGGRWSTGRVPAFTEDGWSLDDTDINDDGDLNDTLYVIAENNSGTLDAVRLSMDNNFSTANSHALRLTETGGGQVNGSAPHIYAGMFHQGYNGKEIGFSLPHASGYWSPNDHEPLTNYTFPLRVRYPNGTAVNGAAVKVDRIIRDRAGSISTLHSPVTATTDSEGMAFLTVNLSAGVNASNHLGRYEIIPAVNTSNTDGFKVLDDGPAPHVQLVDLYDDGFLGFTAHLDAYDNMTRSEVESTTVLSNLPDGNGSYRIKTGLMEDQLGNDCIDVDNDEQCGEETHIVMWEESDWDDNPVDTAVDRLAIDDDRNLSDEDETGTEEYGEHGVEDPFQRDRESLWSSVARIEGLEWPGFAIFNEATDNATVYWERDNDFPATETMTLGIEASALHGSAAKPNLSLQLVKARFNGETYNMSRTISASTNADGVALLDLAPSDVHGHNKSIALDAGENATTGIGGNTHTIELTAVNSNDTVVISIDNGLLQEKTEGSTFTVSGMDVVITDVINLADDDGSATFTIDQIWPRDETIEVIGNASTSSGTQQFETWISTEDR